MFAFFWAVAVTRGMPYGRYLGPPKQILCASCRKHVGTGNVL